MKLFLSCSGDLSRDVAGVLKKFLPAMLHGVEVFTSEHDIASGDRWGVELAKTLEDSNFGILLLTSSNLGSPWLHYEAGALTKHAKGRACGLLLGQLSPTDVKQPLSQFQNRRFNKTEMRQLLTDINAAVEMPIPADPFDLIFEKLWPDLDAGYRNALSADRNQPTTVTHRTQEDLLQEVLLTLRDFVRRADSKTPALGDLLSRPLTEASLMEYTTWKFPGRAISEHWQRQALRDLNLSKYPTLRHLDDTVESALPAVWAYAEERPILFQAGTDYITKALGFADPEFRNHHNFAPQTREAFIKYAHLVKDA